MPFLHNVLQPYGQHISSSSQSSSRVHSFVHSLGSRSLECGSGQCPGAVAAIGGGLGGATPPNHGIAAASGIEHSSARAAPRLCSTWRRPTAATRAELFAARRLLRSFRSPTSSDELTRRASDRSQRRAGGAQRGDALHARGDRAAPARHRQDRGAQQLPLPADRLPAEQPDLEDREPAPAEEARLPQPRAQQHHQDREPRALRGAAQARPDVQLHRPRRAHSRSARSRTTRCCATST